MRFARTILAWVILATILLPTAAPAATPIMIPASDCGFINVPGRTSKNDGVVLGAVDATFNYSVGAIDEAPPLSGSDVPRRNYFTFDLSGITDPIATAALMVYNPLGGYGSPEPTEMYVLTAAMAPPPPPVSMAMLASDLEMVYPITSPPALAAAAALYPKLDAGFPPIGGTIVSAAMDDSMVVIPIVATGYLDAFAGGPVVIGGMLTTLNGTAGPDEFMFGFSKPLIPGVVSPDPPIASPTPTPTLVITLVPEPGSAGLVGVCLITAALRRPRRLRR